jgi:hypothetical protein
MSKINVTKLPKPFIGSERGMGGWEGRELARRKNVPTEIFILL